MKFILIIFSLSCFLIDASAQLISEDIKLDVIKIVADNHDKSILKKGVDTSSLLDCKHDNLLSLNAYFEGFKAGLFAYAENSPEKLANNNFKGELDADQKGRNRAIQLCMQKNNQLEFMGVELISEYNVEVKLHNKKVFSADNKSLILKFQSEDLPIVKNGRVHASKAYKFDAKNFGLIIVKHGIQKEYENIIFVVQ